jgi:organic radical activating enzyme
MNSNKNLSVLTNFGCPYSCVFCISDSQKTKNDFKFKLSDARNIKKLLITGKYERLSISGGGDPLYSHSDISNNIELFYRYIVNLTNEYNIHLSIHTNYKKPTKICNLFDNFVISIHKDDYLHKFHYWFDQVWDSKYNLRFTYIIGYNNNDLEIIKDIIKYLPKDARLTLKQLDLKDIGEIEDFNEIMKLIKDYKNIQFLQSGDYNTYYNLKDGKIYTKFKDIEWR